MATLRRCPECGKRGETVWHDKRDPCPECASQPEHNKWLYTAMLNSHLYASAESAHKQQQHDIATVRQARREARQRGA